MVDPVVRPARRPWLAQLRHQLVGRLTGDHGRARSGARFALADLTIRPRRANEDRIRALCRAVPAGDDTVLARVLGRYKMFLDSRDVGMSSHLLLDGYWEMWLTEAMARIVRPGMTVADVGANLGYFTLLMSDLVGPGGRVHAFEPNPALARRLADTIGINPTVDNTVLHRIGLSDHDRGAELLVPDGEPKNGSLWTPGTHRGAQPVATARMDALPDLATVDVVKIDVEGGEQAVWRGMAGILATRRPMTVFLEFTAVRYADPAAFLAELTAAGFAVSVIELSGEWRPVDAATLLARPATQDQMLLLSRA